MLSQCWSLQILILNFLNLQNQLIDSGVAGNFIDQNPVHRYNIPVCPLIQPHKIQATDGAPIGKGHISHGTEPLQISTLHRESIVFYVTVSSRHPIILGLPWLEQHNPCISWTNKQITHWSTLTHCLPTSVVALAAIVSLINPLQFTFHWNIRTAWKFSARKRPEDYLHFDHMIVLSSCSLDPCHLKGRCIPYHRQNNEIWRNTFERHSSRVTSYPLHPLRQQVSSL